MIRSVLQSEDMKKLLAGIVLIVVVGLGGFLYRAVLEHPATTATACTLDAKICPDGTTIGRTGPSCTFTPCPPPNVSSDALQLAYAVPDGYTEATDLASSEGEHNLLAVYEKIGSSTPATTISIYDFPITTGSTSAQVILEHTVLEPSGMPPKDMSVYTPTIVGTRTYKTVVIERFEGTVYSSYFFARQNDVLEFDVIEYNVETWTSPSLIPANLPGHKALLKMLGTLQDLSPQPE